MSGNEISALKSCESQQEIVLVFPGKYKSTNPQIPLSLIHIADPLIRAGYGVRIFDMRVEDYNDFNLGRPVFVGISSMSGTQIRFGLDFAKKVRSESPSCPIVWGGVHPSLQPEQTAQSMYVDIVIRGEGELIIAKLADKLAAGKPLDNVEGITYKVDEMIKTNPDAPLIDLDCIPIDLPFDLLLLDKYPSIKNGRFHIQTSRGCPHLCGFCYNLTYNKRKWRGKSSKRVSDEIEYVLKKFPKTKIIDIIDDNFFVDKKRVEEICREIVNRKFALTWRASCRFDYLATYDKDFVDLLAKSGCFELDFGGETGSERLQSLICKDVTYEQIIKSLENLKVWGSNIEVYISWVSGLPTETDEDLEATFDLMDKVSGIYSRTQHFGLFIYTPYPSPIMDPLLKGFKSPKTLEEWGDVEVYRFNPPWHSKRQVKKLQTVSSVSLLAFYPRDRICETSIYFRLGYKVLNQIEKYRWRHRYFSFPVELRIVDWVTRRLKGYL